jgi:phenylalanyl-tRNA synthetase alpha subunit
MNITKQILSKIERKNHLIKNHPIKTIKTIIFDYFNGFNRFDNISPFVTVDENFDFLRIPKEHPSRELTDTYYQDENNGLKY